MMEVGCKCQNWFKGVMKSDLINVKTPKIKEESTHRIHPIEQVWGIITTSQKYPTTTLGMGLILNLIELIRRELMLFRKLLEILTANNLLRYLTTMQKMI